MQRSFEFPHQQPPFSLLRLEKQPEDGFEELDSHRGAESALRRREVRGTDPKAEFKAGLQLFWQSINKTRKLHRWSRNGEKDVESGMSKMKREQGVNDLPQKEHVFRSFRQISSKNETKFLLFFTSHPKNIDSLLTTWVYFLLRKIVHTFYFP